MEDTQVITQAISQAAIEAAKATVQTMVVVGTDAGGRQRSMIVNIGP